MDRSAAPWRALDDAPGSTQPAGTGTAATDDGAGPGSRRPPWMAIGGFALAGVLAVAAFAVAAASPHGEVSVDGGTSWASSGSPLRSGDPGPSAVGLIVDVQGAVLHPGLVELPADARVGDAIAAAGGYGPRLDAVRAARELNLAATVKDGDRIVVPSRDDPASSVASPAGAGGDAGGNSPGGLVDLNSATAAQLDELPGVGPVTAQKIIAAREEKPFATVDELRERKILGPSAFEKVKDLVTVR